MTSFVAWLAYAYVDLFFLGMAMGLGRVSEFEGVAGLGNLDAIRVLFDAVEFVREHGLWKEFRYKKT